MRGGAPIFLEDAMAETTPTTWLTRTDLRARGWSKTTCRALLPEPEDTIGPLQLRAENLGRQLPACQCGVLSQVGQVTVRHLAYELALMATGGDQLAALQALAVRNLTLANPAAVGQMLYDLANGRYVNNQEH